MFERGSERRIKQGAVVADFSFDVAFDDFSGAGGAVVVEEIVTILTVFAFGIFAQSLPKGFFFVGAEVECLLVDATAFAAIIFDEGGCAAITQQIIGLSADETSGKVGRIEIEQSVVEAKIDAFFGVVDSDGAVSVMRPDGLSGCTSEH